MQKNDPPVNIHVHSKRHRQTDADGISAKWAIDAIIAYGILQDDSPTYVKSVTYSQEKVGVKEPESTIITIQEA